MNSFSNDIEEITFMLREDQLSIKNFIDTSNGIYQHFPLRVEYSLANSMEKFED
jgi:hypothetical protein